MDRGRFLPAGGNTTFFLVYLFLFFSTCNAKKIHLCDNPPSCGNILNISYPFRLRGDPQNCGDPNYELSCENNTTMLYLDSGKYYVQAINRNNKTIRVVDVGVQKNNCSSLPLRQLYSSFVYPYDVNGSEITFISCENPVYSYIYVDTSPCVNGVYTSKSSFSSVRRHSYVLLMDVDAEDSCSIDMIAMSSSPTICMGNCSYLDIYNKLVYGFELSWSNIYCEECKGRGYCNITQDYTEVVVDCIDYIPYSCRFGCQLLGIAMSSIIYSLMAIVAISILKFLCGTPCVVAFFIYKWRRRHL